MSSTSRRSEFYPRWLQQTRARHEPVFRIEVQGGTILEVLRVDSAGNGGELEAFRTQLRAQALGLQCCRSCSCSGRQHCGNCGELSMARARVARRIRSCCCADCCRSTVTRIAGSCCGHTCRQSECVPLRSQQRSVKPSSIFCITA